MPDSANRTRVRRMGAAAFLRTAREIAQDRLPEEPQPLPEDTEAEFREAYWRSFRWKRARWLGAPVERAPGDLLAYQQMVAEARPEWIVTAGRGGGGRDLYLASLCELVGAGRVLALKPEGEAGPEHPAIEPLAGERTDRRLAATIRERVGAPGSALLLLGLGPADDLIEAFNLLSPIVPVGSWVVFEDTIMNGHPIWPGMGAGPAEAVNVLTRRHPQFVRDRPLTQLGVTFNPDGYLKRTA